MTGMWVADPATGGQTKVWRSKPGPKPRGFELTIEQRRRGWSQYVQGSRTPFAMLAAQEYRRAWARKKRAKDRGATA